MKYFAIACALFLFTAQLADAQQRPAPSGDWEGHIEIQGQQLIIKPHFQKTDSGYTGTIDIPQQGAVGLQLQKISLTGTDSVHFEFVAGPGNPAQFKGAFQSDLMRENPGK